MKSRPPDHGGLVRVPADRPLTRAQLAACAVLADGHDLSEAARLLGVERSTVVYHVQRAAEKIPGDLPMTAKCVAWYRGASLDVLGAFGPAPRQQTLAAALSIVEGRGCPVCAYAGVQEVPPHGSAQTDGRSAGLPVSPGPGRQG